MLEVIANRRSCRSFKADLVSKEKLEKVLQAGLYAPSPVNKQPWEFLIVTNVDVKEKFKQAAQNTLPKLREKSGWAWLDSYKVDFLTEAPLYIVVIGDPTKNGAEQFLSEPGHGYIEACSACIQNMLLAATNLGIASLWYSLFEKADARGIFAISEDKDPLAVICLGVASSLGSMPRRKSLEDKVSYLD